MQVVDVRGEDFKGSVDMAIMYNSTARFGADKDWHAAGGKIPGALNLPSEGRFSFHIPCPIPFFDAVGDVVLVICLLLVAEWKDDDKVDALVSQIKDKQTVVVHCTMSRQRGPTAASRLLERLQVVQGEGKRHQRLSHLKRCDGGLMLCVSCRWAQSGGSEGGLYCLE